MDPHSLTNIAASNRVAGLRTLASFPLAPNSQAALFKAGFRSVPEVLAMTPANLSKEAGISLKESVSVLKTLRAGGETIPSSASRSSSSSSNNNNNNNSTSTTRTLPGSSSSKLPTNTGYLPSSATAPTGSSALELLHQEREFSPLSTGSMALDAMMGGGVALGRLTEFCGLPGLGKTQLGLQLAIHTLLSSPTSQVVYIDTEGSFSLPRLVQIAAAAIAGSSTEPSQPIRPLLSRLHLFRVHDYVEQLATVNTLPSFISSLGAQYPPTSSTRILVVMDSVTFHFRRDFDDMAARTRLLTGLAQRLMSLATSTSGTAVVLMNQVTSKPGSSTASGSSEIVPALGESWAHTCSARVMLYWAGSQRRAHLYKSAFHPSATAAYTITHRGICDISHFSQPSTASTNASSGSKRGAPIDDGSSKKAKTN